jgi:hypothetical protein
VSACWLPKRVTTDRKVFETELFSSRGMGGWVTKTTGLVSVTEALAKTVENPRTTETHPRVAKKRLRFVIFENGARHVPFLCSDFGSMLA